MVNIFKKKDLRNTHHDSKQDRGSLRPALIERISDYSHKSPKLVSDRFALPSPSAEVMPDVSIPDPPDPRSHPAAYLRSIHAVRQRSRLVLEEAKVNALNHFDVDLSKFKDTADYVVSIIKVSLSTRALKH